MKPFDLQKALSGAEVVTDTNKTAKYITTTINKNATPHEVYWFKLDEGSGRESMIAVDPSGLSIDPETTTKQLFIKPQKKTVWVNIWNDAEGNLWSTGRPFDTETEAHAMSYKANHVGTYSIEIEI